MCGRSLASLSRQMRFWTCSRRRPLQRKCLGKRQLSDSARQQAVTAAAAAAKEGAVQNWQQSWQHRLLRSSSGDSLAGQGLARGGSCSRFELTTMGLVPGRGLRHVAGEGRWQGAKLAWRSEGLTLPGEGKARGLPLRSQPGAGICSKRKGACSRTAKPARKVAVAVAAAADAAQLHCSLRPGRLCSSLLLRCALGAPVDPPRAHLHRILQHSAKGAPVERVARPCPADSAPRVADGLP